MNDPDDIISIDIPATMDHVDDLIHSAQRRSGGSVASILGQVREELAALRYGVNLLCDATVTWECQCSDPEQPVYRADGLIHFSEELIDSIRSMPRGTPGVRWSDVTEAPQSYTPSTTSHSVMQGYTGDLCDLCGSARMRRNGTCLLCENCGGTTGCS